jgi:predicted TIM-barrel fold metal-dependent hydrolase
MGMRDGYRIVDIDTHVIPAMELLHDYADDELRTRWGELTPYLRTNPPRPELGDYAHDSTSLSVAPYGFDRPLRGPQQDERAVAGGRGALLGRTTPVMTEAPEPAIQHDNSEGRLRSMDREGVDVNLIFPGPFANASSALEAGLSCGLLASYNRYILDYCGVDPGRLKAVIQVHALDDHAGKEIARHADSSAVAAVSIVLPEGVPIDSDELHPIWAAMNDHDLPLLYHSFFFEPPYFPGYRDVWGNVVVARTAAHPWGAQRLLSYLVLAGLFDRYPNLRVGFAEVGAGWLPFWLKRLDAQASYMRSQVPELRHSAVEYARQGRIVCGLELYEGPDLLRSIVETLGDGVAAFQSDFPHPQCNFPHSPDDALSWDWDAIAHGESSKTKFFSANAEALLRMS